MPSLIFYISKYERNSFMLKTKDLIDLTHTQAAPILEDKEYPWEALPLIKEFILQLGPTLDPEVYENKGDGIWIAKSAKVFDSAWKPD